MRSRHRTPAQVLLARVFRANLPTFASTCAQGQACCSDLARSPARPPERRLLRLAGHRRLAGSRLSWRPGRRPPPGPARPRPARPHPASWLPPLAPPGTVGPPQRRSCSPSGGRGAQGRRRGAWAERREATGTWRRLAAPSSAGLGSETRGALSTPSRGAGADAGLRPPRAQVPGARQSSSGRVLQSLRSLSPRPDPLSLLLAPEATGEPALRCLPAGTAFATPRTPSQGLHGTGTEGAVVTWPGGRCHLRLHPLSLTPLACPRSLTGAHWGWPPGWVPRA